MKKVSPFVVISMKYHTIIPKLLEVAFEKTPSSEDASKNVHVFALCIAKTWYTGFGF